MHYRHMISHREHCKPITPYQRTLGVVCSYQFITRYPIMRKYWNLIRNVSISHHTDASWHRIIGFYNHYYCDNCVHWNSTDGFFASTNGIKYLVMVTVTDVVLFSNLPITQYKSRRRRNLMEKKVIDPKLHVLS